MRSEVAPSYIFFPLSAEACLPSLTPALSVMGACHTGCQGVAGVPSGDPELPTCTMASSLSHWYSAGAVNMRSRSAVRLQTPWMPLCPGIFPRKKAGAGYISICDLLTQGDQTLSPSFDRQRILYHWGNSLS